MKASHVMISGRVQGVGYRDWLVRTAQARGVDGWVRNRSDGRVEALLAGEAAAVDAVLAACREGPRAARVTDVVSMPAEAPGQAGFRWLPTV